MIAAYTKNETSDAAINIVNTITLKSIDPYKRLRYLNRRSIEDPTTFVQPIQ